MKPPRLGQFGRILSSVSAQDDLNTLNPVVCQFIDIREFLPAARARARAQSAVSFRCDFRFSYCSKRMEHTPCLHASQRAVWWCSLSLPRMPRVSIS
jgi:hypothetical protein